ncbi:MAG: ISAs1 family transposase [Cyanobacteria bacterium P01_D01_bin.71]
MLLFERQSMCLIEQLKQIPDHRQLRGRRHPLWMVLFLTLLGFLCGYRGYRPLADFVQQHAPDLRVSLHLSPHQPMPSYSTFRRMSVFVDPQGWAAAFNVWSLATLPSALGAVLSVDGKSLRCTSVGGKTAAQNFVAFVSLYERHLGVLHLRVMENAQTSEIHVAQDALQQVLPHLPAGQCLSLDALHTTRRTVQTIGAAQQHYLLPVKRNRAHSHAAIEALVTITEPQETATAVDWTHGREIQRQVQRFRPTPALQKTWPQLAWIGVVQRQGTRSAGSPTDETVYYITSAPWRAQQLLEASRQHWQIENGLHWVKDVTFQEAYPPRRGSHAPVTWGIFNTFAITLARRQGWRTVPQALRVWANQLQRVFSFLV